MVDHLDTPPEQPAAARPPSVVVVQPLRPWVCAVCAGMGEMLIMEDQGPLYLICAELDHLVFLPSGNTALTRRSRAASGLFAVLVRFSRARKRYERQGILVEDAAVRSAEEHCLADEDARARQRERGAPRRAAEDVTPAERFATRITELFPGCPVPRAHLIARHAGTRGGGRVGRTAAGRSLEDAALTLAVVASIRHEDTAYDALLMAGADRDDARRRGRDDVDAVLEQWRQ